MPRDKVLTASLNKLRDDVQSMVSARADRIMEGLSKSITDAFVNNVQKRLISRATPKDAQSAMLVQNIADSIVVDESVWAGKYEYRIVIPRDPEGLVMFLEFGTGLVGYTQGNPDAVKYGWSYAVNRNKYIYKKHEGRLGFIFEKTGANYIDRDDESPNISVKQYTPTKQWGGGESYVYNLIKYGLEHGDPISLITDKRFPNIANRFSKIGSVPELAETDLRALLERVIDYMKHRTSERVKFVLHMPETFPKIPLNAPLFEWVIENLCKNAVDAMDGEGMLVISAGETAKKYYVEVEDTGKGIDKRHFRTVFRPGYTTKARGWGLGLSLVRRIVVEYHHGHIFVKQSEINKGTIFRIELKK